MKQLILALTAFSIVTISACDKKTSTTPITTNPNNNDTTDTDEIVFNINGISDLKIKADEQGMLALAITHVSGTQGTVNLALSGLPGNATHKFSASSGIPTYASVLTIEGNMATAGTYPLIIIALSESGVVKSYKFNLIIEDATDCATPLAGNYSGTRECSSSGPINKNLIITNGFGLNKIYISGVTPSMQVPATLDCSTNTITIPEFEELATNYLMRASGTGTFVLPNTIKLNITSKVYLGGSLASTTNCEYIATKK